MLLAWSALPLAAAAAARSSPRPIIGILALPVEHADCITMTHASSGDLATSGGATSCFHSLYVKWLEQAGARVAPIPFDLYASRTSNSKPRNLKCLIER